MKRYRLKDWKNPYTEENSEIAIIVESGPMPDEAFEAGADAMLEGLKKEGTHQPSEWIDDTFGLHTTGAGTLVFIPDEGTKEETDLEYYKKATTVEFTADDIIK